MAMSSADILKSTQPGVINGHLLNGVRVSSVEAQGAWQALADTRSDVSRIEIPADPHERVAFVRRWMEKNQKTLKQGGMAATLVLPLLAQQALADKMVPVNDLQGVSEVIRQPNGSLTLMMNSGQRIDLAAADVALANGRVVVDVDALMQQLGNDSGLLVPLSQLPDVQTWELLPDGNVLVTMADGSQLVVPRWAVVEQGDLLLISPSDALQQGLADGEDFGNLLFVPSASFTSAPSSTAAVAGTTGSNSAPVSSFADIPPWLYIGGGAIAVGAAAGGGGGGGGGNGSGDSGSGGGTTPPPVPPVTISGYVIDGYISGATVTREFDANSVTTDGNGFFSGLQGSGILTATGGVDISTGLPFTGVLRAPDGSTVITPLTTMMVQLSQQFGLNNADAQAAIKTALNLDARIDLMTTDPLSVSSPNVELLIAGVKVASLLAMAATAGISSADALSRLGVAFNQAGEEGRALTNQEMADALGLPAIAGQVKQALDAIDAAGENLDIDAYRDGSRNPLRDAQREAQDPDSNLSDTIEARADVPYLTLQQALTLAQNGELPAQYLINPNEPVAAGNLGLTAAADRLALVQRILAGDYDVETAPIALTDIYTWSIRASAGDVLVSGGLERPEVVGAERVTLTNSTIRPDQYRALETLDNFELGNVVVRYTLEQALDELADDLIMPANYTINPDTPYPVRNLTLREAAELLDHTRELLDRAQNAESDNLTREELFTWHIVDSVANILAASSASPQVSEALSIRVTAAQITPEQFVRLNSLDNFVLEPTEVRYTLAQALEAEQLASNYIITLNAPLPEQTLTVAGAQTLYRSIETILDGANNSPVLTTLFIWNVSDSASRIINALDAVHVTEARRVSVTDETIQAAQYEQLASLGNFDLGNTVVLYTLQQAVTALEADVALADNYEILANPRYSVSNLSVEQAASRLAIVESLIGEDLFPQRYTWTIRDSVDAILAAAGEKHLTSANTVTIDANIITLANYDALAALQGVSFSNLDTITVEYTLQQAIDAGSELRPNYAINTDPASRLERSYNSIGDAEQDYDQYLSIVQGAQNNPNLRDAFRWDITDSAPNIIGARTEAYLLQAQEVRVSDDNISQQQYQDLRALNNFVLGDTIVDYQTLADAVGARADNVLAPADSYRIINDTDYVIQQPLTVANALTQLNIVKGVLAGATNRSEADFAELYIWNISDTPARILNAATQDHITGANTIFADANGRITFAEYTALVEALGIDGFTYNLVLYTLQQAIDEDNGDRLVDDYSIAATPVVTIADPLTAEAAEALYSQVSALLEGAIAKPAITSALVYSITDSAASLLETLGEGDAFPSYVRQAQNVRINDETTISFDDYEALATLANFRIQTYTLQEAVGIFLDDDSELAANYIINTTTAYQAQNLSVADALTYKEAVDTILGGDDAAARNARINDEALGDLYSWTIRDSAENILAQKSGAEFSDIVQGAAVITLTDTSIVFEDEYLNGLEGLLTPSDLANVRVDFFYDADVDIAFIESEGFENNYGILVNTNGPLEYLQVSSAIAQVEYQRAFDIVDGASNVPPVSIESLVVWTIEDSVENIDVSAPWVGLAKEIQLTETELTAEQFLKFVTVEGDEVSVLNSLQTDTLTSVKFTPQEAYDNRIAFLNIANSNPGYSLDILNAPALAFANPFNVSDASALDATLDDIVIAAGSAPSKLDAYSWRVEDSALNLLESVSGTLVVIDDSGVQNASEVRVTDSEISISQYEALVQLETFVDAGFVVGYSLEEALDRLPSEFGLAENYILIDASPFNIGELNAYDAQRIYQLVERLIDGAQNGDEVSVDSLMDWVVKDTLSGYEAVGIRADNDYLREADGVIITGSGVNGEIAGGDAQANRQAFSGTNISYTEEAGSPAPPYSLTYTLSGSETLGDPIIDFSVGEGGDVFFIDLTADEFDALRGDGTGFDIYGDAATLGANTAFAVFTTESFANLEWLNDLGLEDNDVVYLLANENVTGNNAQLFKVEDVGDEFSTQILANFENLDLNGFLEENWNTNYSIT
ncbi:hypothetical protein PZ78_11115 [Vreelandella venusta]|nr:hypothetical protein PZ78_11115 [Halomonas hydrothermalis]